MASWGKNENGHVGKKTKKKESKTLKNGVKTHL